MNRDIGCRATYPRCTRGCPSSEAHRAVFAALSRKPGVVVVKQQKSSKINYEKLQNIFRSNIIGLLDKKNDDDCHVSL